MSILPKFFFDIVRINVKRFRLKTNFFFHLIVFNTLEIPSGESKVYNDRELIRVFRQFRSWRSKSTGRNVCKWTSTAGPRPSTDRGHVTKRSSTMWHCKTTSRFTWLRFKNTGKVSFFKIKPEVRPEVIRKLEYLTSYITIKVLYWTVKRHRLELVIAILSRVYF